MSRQDESDDLFSDESIVSSGDERPPRGCGQNCGGKGKKSQNYKDSKGKGGKKPTHKGGSNKVKGKGKGGKGKIRGKGKGKGKGGGCTSRDSDLGMKAKKQKKQKVGGDYDGFIPI